LSILEDSRFAIDRKIEATGSIVQNFKEVGNHLEKLNDMYVDYLKSKTILGEEIGRIESISRIMDDFIDQAGILALNAAILAARNDSLDSGFGVIADEIKELAERTGASTGKIKTIVNNTTQQLSGMEERTIGAKVEFRRTKDLLKEILTVQKTRSDELKDEANRMQALLEDTGQDRTQIGTILDTVRLLKSQIAKTGGILAEKLTATEKSMETSDKMKEMAGQVMNAAQEQTVGANQIAGASESIRDLSSDAKNASEKVKEALQDIVQLIQTIEGNSEEIRLKSDTLREVVDDFSGELTSLSTEIARFKLPDNK
jgi:methyl-accepting chemotaxis protein